MMRSHRTRAPGPRLPGNSTPAWWDAVDWWDLDLQNRPMSRTVGMNVKDQGGVSPPRSGHSGAGASPSQAISQMAHDSGTGGTTARSNGDIWGQKCRGPSRRHLLSPGFPTPTQKELQRRPNRLLSGCYCRVVWLSEVAFGMLM